MLIEDFRARITAEHARYGGFSDVIDPVGHATVLHLSALPDDVRSTLPRPVQAYITTLETELARAEAALSAASGELAALRARRRGARQVSDGANERRNMGVATRSHPGWSRALIERSAGGWQGEPPERPDQGNYEVREPFE